MNDTHLRKRIFVLQNYSEFVEAAMETFLFQYHNNPVYKKFASLLNLTPGNVDAVDRIPFLPAGFFRNHSIITGSFYPDSSLTFFSSGTTKSNPAIHIITRPSLYIESFISGFESVFGSLSQYNIFALLPGYLERSNSSLVFMVDNLIKAGKSDKGGFYINDYEGLYSGLIESVSSSQRKTILVGVTFALIGFMRMLRDPLPEIILVETGGMKGHGKEMIREELYQILRKGYGVEHICSEYGMTELCSQAWSKDNGVFNTPPWMKVLIRDLNDPFRILPPGKRGGINIIDLANLYSCSFIATDDIGIMNQDGSFEVLGRVDGSEQRGCNLLTVPMN